MSDYDLPELPSDEELGIAGIELDEDEGADGSRAEPEDRPPPPAPPPGGGEPRPRPEEPTERPSRRWRGPVTLLALAVLAWLSGSGRTLPGPVPATAPDTVFSSARAMVELVELARRAHPPGSPEHTRVRQRILESLGELGLEPVIQTTTSGVRRGGTFRAATVRNVVARIPGTEPSGAILVTAHYDGRTLSPAAGDDASGVVAILEALRAVRAGAPLRNDVIVLFTDAEELGLLGARAFVRDHAWMQDVSVVLSVEMRGGGGPSIMFETGPENGWIVEALKAGDPHPIANSLSYEVYRRLPNDTDFTPFREAGRQGLNFAGIGRAHVYHQTFDTPENFQEATLQHHGEHVLGMIRELGGRDLSAVDAPDRVFFRLPFLGLLTYGTLWVPVLGVLLLLGAAAVIFLGHRASGGAGSLLVGLVLGVVAAAGAAGAGWALFRQVRPLHPEYGLLHGSAFHSEGWYVLAVVAVAFALVTGLFGAVRRRASLPGLAAGALALPLLAALFLTFAAPLAAMNLQWPVLGGLAGAALVAGVAGARPPGLARWVVLLGLAPVVLAFMVPLTELIWQAMNVSILPVLGGLTVLALLLLVPLLDALAEPNRWWAPLTGLVLAGACLGAGLLHARPAADRPTPSTLAYTLDRETGEARWISRPGRGLAWARERAGALETEGNLEAFLAGAATVLSGPAPAASAEPPEAAAAGDSTTRAAGRTRIALRSRIGAEMMTVGAAPGSEGIRWRAVNGRPVEGATPVTSVVHWGTPEDALVLEFEPPPGADSVRLVVIEHHLRPAELVGEEPFRRPPDLVPSVNGISDRALIRSIVTLPTAPGPGLSGPLDPATTAPADTLDPEADTLAAPADTLIAPVDSLGAPADSSGPRTDTMDAPVDTLTQPADTLAAPPDTTGAPPAGPGAPPDTLRTRTRHDDTP